MTSPNPYIFFPCVLLVLVGLGLAHLLLHLGEDSRAGESNAAPALEAEDVALEEDAEEDTEDLPSGGDSSADQRVEVGNGEEDEGLARSRAEGELDNLAHDLGVGGAVSRSRREFTEGTRDDNSSESHEEVSPEHEVIGLWLDSDGSSLRLQFLLNAAGDAVAHKGQHDEGNTED